LPISLFNFMRQVLEIFQVNSENAVIIPAYVGALVSTTLTVLDEAID